MTKYRETFFDRIRNRLAPPNAVRVIADLARCSHNGDLDYMDVKEASDYVERYKLEARDAIIQWRKWKARIAVSAVLEPLKAQEGRILRNNAAAKACLYFDARRDFADLVGLAFDQCEAKAKVRFQPVAANDAGERS